MPAPLDYMPLTYRFRHPAWHKGAGWCIFLILVGIGVRCIESSWSLTFLKWWIASLALSTAATLWLWWHGLDSECRIEGDMLCWRDDHSADRQFTSLPLTQIIQITTLTGDDEDTQPWCEIEVRERGRIRVESEALIALLDPKRRGKEQDRFKAAILAANPQVRLADRKAELCYECRKPMMHFRERCSCCGAAVTVRGRYV